MVVGILAGSQPPTIDVPPGRIYVDVTDHPAIQGGESYDGELFIPQSRTMSTQLAQVKANLQAVADKVGVIITPPAQKVGP